MTPDQITAAAAALLQAEQTGVQTGLLSLQYPEITLNDAYAVQAALVGAKQAGGAKGIGWKIGLTSRAMQQALNITTPNSGILLDDMLFADGATIPPGRFIQPRVEAEIAFVMRTALAGADVTRKDVLAATGAVAPVWKFSTPVSCGPTRRPGPPRSSILWPTMPPMPGLCWGPSGTASRISTCARWAPSSSAMGWSKKPGWAPGCWMIR